MLQKFSMFITETREAAAQEAVAHHSRAAEAKGEAGKYSEGSTEWHEHMAQHHRALMMAHRSEAKSKYRVADRTKSVKAADSHFSKAMAHHLAAQKD